VEQIEEEVVRGEAAFAPLMKEAGRKPAFFRFPYNHTGDTRAKHDAIEEILALFEQKQYKFVSLAAGQSDPAYQTPDTYITAFGPMWGCRWADERNVKFDGSGPQFGACSASSRFARSQCQSRACST
jgi:hypothetical protein